MESEEKVRSKVKHRLGIDQKRLANSFKYAWQGIIQSYRGEQNLKIHTFMAILVIVFGFFLKISYMEWLVCLLLIGLVLMSEFINTAIESTYETSKIGTAAKDTAAAGVLMMALISAIIGLVIFIPKIIDFIGGYL